MKESFEALCKTLQLLRETRSTNEKISVCAAYLKDLEDDKNLKLAAQFIGEGAFSNVSGKRASVGSRTSGIAAAIFCEIDYDFVFKPCRTATGSSSETIGRLMENVPAAVSKRSPQSLELSSVQEMFDALRNVSSRADKIHLLHTFWAKMTPSEIKFFVRMLGQGSLRIGFETKSLVASIAKAYGFKKDKIRHAHMITGSIGKAAVLAKNNRLDDAAFRLFQPLSFMLASPVDNRKTGQIKNYLAEEKFDGMRAQVHVEGGQVKIFSRDLNEITHTFPDITAFFQKKSLPAHLFDGEICIYREETIMPFQHLQKRMGLKKPREKIIERFPALFITYDLLYAAGNPVFELPLYERRRLLESITQKYSLPVSAQYKINSKDDIEYLFNRALEHGNEGLMLKHSQSRYEYGRRGRSWLKVKKPAGSLDTVIMYAHAGSGKRGGLYSDFTLGISVKNDERYEEEFIPIGKAYGGYSNEDLITINKKIKELAIEKYGPTLGIKPGIVIEVEFDSIRENRRTKAGFTLRFPRFRAIRWDLKPDDVNSLNDVEQTYETTLNRNRKPQKANPSFLF